MSCALYKNRGGANWRGKEDERQSCGRAGRLGELGMAMESGLGVIYSNGGGAVPTLPCSPSMATLWPCGHLRSSLSGASIEGEQGDAAAQGVGGASGRRWCCAGRRAARRASQGAWTMWEQGRACGVLRARARTAGGPGELQGHGCGSELLEHCGCCKVYLCVWSLPS